VYLGNFTYYYSPIKVDQNRVDVPYISCTAYRIEGEELVKYENNNRRCSYYTVEQYYSVKAKYIFDFDEKNIPIEKAKKIAFAWYQQSNGNYYIKSINKESDGQYSISLSGGACSGMSELVTEVKPNKFVFSRDENQVFVCS